MGERDDTLLDVTLARDGHARRWIISRSGDAWIYRAYGPNTASIDGSYIVAAVQAYLQLTQGTGVR